MGRGFNKSPRGGSNGRGRGRGGGGGGGGRAFGKGQKHQQQRGGSRSFEPSPSRNNKQRGRQAFKPRPPPPLSESLSALPKFVKKPRFGGAKLGYFFSLGKAGLGYYVDRVQIGNMGDKLKARLAATLKPAAEVVAKPIKSKGLTDGEATGAGKAAGIANVQEGAKKRPMVKSNGKETGGASIDSVRSKPGAPGAGDGSRGGSSDEDGSEGDSEEDSSEEEEEEEGNGVEGSAAGEGGVVDHESSSDEGSDEEGEEDDAAAVATNRGKEKQAAKGGAGKPVVVNGGSSVQESEEEEGSESDGVEISGEEEEEDEGEEDDEKDGVRGEEPKSTESHNEVSGAEGVDGDEEEAEAPQEDDEKKSFESLGVTGPLCEAAAQLGWTHATDIQKEALPLAFEGRDVIGLAETGSGKTGAFAIPILQALLENPQRLFAVVMAPTRELAFQINEVMEALGVGIGLKTVCIVGGIDMFQQSVALALKPHVVIATPGRLVDHLENTKGFSLRTAKYLVLDEADRMLGMDFEEEINKVLSVLPRERRTFLFSATMTSKVAKLQRASLRDPVRVEVAHKFATPKTLVQQYLFIPAKHKDCYLAYVLNEFAGQSTIVFVSTCNNAQRVALLLRNLGFQAVCLHGQMGQPKRLGALGKFKSGQRNVLIATDVASRGLDIPSVDLVVNMEIPSHGKDYIHRVGRTARAGRAGRSIAFVTQYDVEVYQRMESLIGQKLPPYTCDEETVLVLQERVGEAQRMAAREMREADFNRKGKRRGGEGAEDAETVVRSFKRQRMGGGRGGGRGGRGGGGGGEGGREGGTKIEPPPPRRP